MKASDREKLELNTILAIEGYSSYDTDYFDSTSYRSLRTTVLDNLPFGGTRRFKFTFFPKSEILRSGRFVIESHFGDLDLRVRFADGDDMQSQLIALFGLNPDPDKYDEIIDYVNDHISLIPVTDIPIELDCGGRPNGFVGTTYFYDNQDMEEEFYKKLPHCVSSIVLTGNCDEATKCVYVHEMSHALIDRHKGNVINFLNGEVFPIFMENVAASEVDLSGNLLDRRTLYRILHTKHGILENEMMEFNEEEFLSALHHKKYIISTLHATALFDTYSKGSNRVKKEINDDLGKVICEEEVLENVLEHYGASLDRGTKILKKQIRSFHDEMKKGYVK